MRGGEGRKREGKGRDKGKLSGPPIGKSWLRHWSPVPRGADDLRSLAGLYSVIRDRRYGGMPVDRVLKTTVANLNRIRYRMGSQWSCFRTGVMLSWRPVHVTTRSNEPLSLTLIYFMYV